MKKYLLAQLTQVSAWIGLIIIIAAFIAPREWIAVGGLALILTDDEALKGWVAKHAPWIAKKFEDWTV
jgi:hypothetical protein